MDLAKDRFYKGIGSENGFHSDFFSACVFIPFDTVKKQLAAAKKIELYVFAM
ncbi:MAG: hypothetical protein HC867_06025 [Bacteroidia bacterium]|nr:hypothetical protein [Bacteroidia bacterium]